MTVEAYDEAQVDGLRSGDLDACFGSQFAGLPLASPALVPSGKLHLIDRVTHLDPEGGRYGLGLIRAEADIHPDDWFLTCHFVDDQVMPGTLMYECCMHTLRVFLMRMGWVGEQDEVVCEPVPGVASRLKCRGQVVAGTKKATYEVAIKEIGYRPEPYALADALMYADGKPIVEMTNMSLRMSGLSRERVEGIWSERRVPTRSQAPPGNASLPGSAWRAAAEEGGFADVREAEPRAVRSQAEPGNEVFGHDRILAFAIGKPSEAFGEPYKVFDHERVIARLPGPPYQFLDRITTIHAEPWQMKAGGVIEAEYDIPPEAWYFAANRQVEMPLAVMVEIALQPCGWLAAYMGSALTSPIDLSFRNLSGEATLLAPVTAATGTLTTAVKIEKVASSGGMIIQHFTFTVRSGAQLVYRGDTYFGFFSKAALENQVGIRDAKPHEPDARERLRGRTFAYPQEPPFPGKELRMVDEIELFVPDGGAHGLGFVQGRMAVDPEAWFFKAHFYQDPVCPGSLGLESLMQILKVVAVERWQPGRNARFATISLAKPHRWTYRGQVIPRDRQITVQAVVTAVDDQRKTLLADGYLMVDGRVIYQMNEFGLNLVTGSE
jgi:3-hydroxymyristoyl/3-hydroxydecanoyl-(acyl carrier protein) dehydratase